MQLAKKISIIISVLFLFVVGSASPIQKRTLKSYTFSYYSNFFNVVLIPDIEKYIDENPLLPYSEERGNKLVKGLVDGIQSHINARNILLFPGQNYQISLLANPDNRGNVIYYVNVTIPLFEYDEREKVPLILGISKNFFAGIEPFRRK